MTDRYKVAILRGASLDSSEILLETSPDGVRLPEFEIRKYQRPAQELINGIRERYRFETVAMATPHLTPSVDPSQPDVPQPFLYVLECLSQESPAPAGNCWLPVALAELQHAEDPQIGVALDQLTAPQGPFARAGWSARLTDWIRGLGVPVTGVFRQIHGDHLFAIVRFEALHGPAVWFKAVGEPCLTEWYVTPALAAENPDCFPRLLGTLPEWRGWLMEEASGKLLFHHDDYESWQRAVTALAQLQLRYVAQTGRLLLLGCKDQRLSGLRQDIAPFFEAMVEVMARQQSERVERLDRTTLMRMADDAHRVLDSAEGLRIPDSLTHGDFGPHNVIVDDFSAKFIDWAEASVGPAFSTLEYFLVWRKKRFPDRDEWSAPLRKAYTDVWRDIVPAHAAREHARIAPALTALTVCLRSEIDVMLRNENRAGTCGRSQEACTGCWPPSHKRLPHDDCARQTSHASIRA
jgi:hypothetical protein